MREGRVTGFFGGRYRVDFGEETTLATSGKSLRNSSGKILVGDRVEVEADSIKRVLERKNRLIRPAVANVDLICAVISNVPKPDLVMLDKLILTCRKEGIEIILAVNKSDMDDGVYGMIEKEYAMSGVKSVSVSCLTGENIQKLITEFSEKTVCLAGQSAVGKTSIINRLTGLSMRTGNLSEKTERGRHTTTGTQIFKCEDFYLTDTPGFSAFNAELEADELPSMYPEFSQFAKGCRYRDCSHIGEQGCQVAIKAADAPWKGRYERYLKIYEELKERGNRRYGKN